jgi:hypothetical protein
MVETRWYHDRLHNQAAAAVQAYLLLCCLRRVASFNVQLYLSE